MPTLSCLSGGIGIADVCQLHVLTVRQYVFRYERELKALNPQVRDFTQVEQRSALLAASAGHICVLDLPPRRC